MSVCQLTSNKDTNACQGDGNCLMSLFHPLREQLSWLASAPQIPLLMYVVITDVSMGL